MVALTLSVVNQNTYSPYALNANYFNMASLGDREQLQKHSETPQIDFWLKIVLLFAE
jgi:hypothetical protein